MAHLRISEFFPERQRVGGNKMALPGMPAAIATITALALLLAPMIALGRTLVGKTAVETARVDGKPADFRWVSCSFNPRSVMGRIPPETKLKVLGGRVCSLPGYDLVFYKVAWKEDSVWISSGTTR